MTTGQVEQFTTEEHAQRSAMISGDWVVWQDARHQADEPYPPRWDIYAMNLNKRQEQRITGPTSEGYNTFSLSGTTVVWTDSRHADRNVTSYPSNAPDFNNEIYAYDLATGTETRITDNPANDQAPAISGHTIAWLRQGTLQGGDIFAYDLNTGKTTQVSHSGYAEFQPSAADGFIVWSDARASLGNTSGDVIRNGVQGQADLYGYEPTTGNERQLLATAPGWVAQGAITEGRYVVFAAGGGIYKAYVIDMGKE